MTIKHKACVFITQNALDSLLEGAKGTHPLEFVAILEGRSARNPQAATPDAGLLGALADLLSSKASKAKAKAQAAKLARVVELQGEGASSAQTLVFVHGVIIPPLAFNEESSSGFSDWYIPPSPKHVGTFHSHPGRYEARPSRQDTFFFSHYGPAHLIASAPYRASDVRAFDSTGKRVPLFVAKQ